VHEYGTLKSVKGILRRGVGKRGNNGREIPQQNPLYTCLSYANKNIFKKEKYWFS
jgi:hypothetical protein